MVEAVLARDETVPRRPFTSVSLYEGDLCVLNAMLEDVRALIARWEAGTASVVPHRRISWRVHGLKHRTIICEPERLGAARSLFVVGFLAQRNHDQDPGPLESANTRIVQNFRDYPGIYSYSSRQLADGNWVNLILNDAPKAAENWRGCPAHARAVAELSPTHYLNVRIHSGRLPGGLVGRRSIILERTRYVDYRAREPWRAVRELIPAAVA